jgi:signal transduction histidine kinase
MLRAGTYRDTHITERDVPIVVALMPSTPRQRKLAVIFVVAIVTVAVLVAPFATIHIGRIDSFVPVLQTVLSAADLLTATLLLAQYSVQPNRALLAVASGYLFSASFAFLQTLSFPGGYAPNGIIGDGFNTPAWFFVLWHTSFLLSILTYSLLKDKKETSRRPAAASIATTLTCVVGTVVALSWIVTAEVRSLPSFYATSITLQTRLGNQINFALSLLAALPLLLLFIRRRTVLDLWLMVTLVAWLPNFLVATVASSVRFSVGWYAARGFALIASCMLLAMLLTEMIMLYSRLTSALTMLRRERANRLVSIDAATAAIAHEIRNPLGAITLNANVGLRQILAQPPRLEEISAILKEIEESSLRAAATIVSVRGLFKDAVNQPATMRIEEAAEQVLRLLQNELRLHDISVTTEFSGQTPSVSADPAQLQQVVLNLVKNAIDAMISSPSGGRRLFVGTRRQGSSSVHLCVQDTGAGVQPDDQDRIFEAFFTTKPTGVGLGLPICRTIVERYGGSLVLVKSSPQGSMFEVVLPAAPPRDGINT